MIPKHRASSGFPTKDRRSKATFAGDATPTSATDGRAGRNGGGGAQLSSRRRRIPCRHPATRTSVRADGTVTVICAASAPWVARRDPPQSLLPGDALIELVLRCRSGVGRRSHPSWHRAGPTAAGRRQTKAQSSSVVPVQSDKIAAPVPRLEWRLQSISTTGMEHARYRQRVDSSGERLLFGIVGFQPPAVSGCGQKPICRHILNSGHLPRPILP